MYQPCFFGDVFRDTRERIYLSFLYYDVYIVPDFVRKIRVVSRDAVCNSFFVICTEECAEEFGG